MSHFFSPHADSPLGGTQEETCTETKQAPETSPPAVPTPTREVLTVQVAVPDAFHVLRVDEVVASLPHNVYRGQIHVIADPAIRTTDWNSEGEKI